MRFVNPIPFVSDIARSKVFYRDLLGLKILNDFGNFVLFDTGFAIHEGKSLEQTIWGKSSETSASYGRRNVLLYFEHEDVDAAYAAIAPHVDLIHPVEEQEWGQRVFRFYDPDGHAVEIGEPQ
ncbi:MULTISPECIES: VOC family protein [unclassified Rhizobium]|jgi:catechol 2,3-dioxygenase-like lactoylglutathione lyase family enzyme|uniref:VOC family protein n=1 Tax=unclassified Rhizobium TaxID=2613769 RepID=UPI0006478038|nr:MULTISPECIES: VOC family protein [unclassified Rhizobium]MBN8950621.1 VOC family protein [Rhizobium tropici]OJY66166.1 MAG: bleomycin resistance protein [Rhizobium sp. 60-20]RKD69279.1 catechol 2,3-dioxygenase-like lactoylglutathione lyase family enzyme [Rhizobium sp. WW_1]